MSLMDSATLREARCFCMKWKLIVVLYTTRGQVLCYTRSAANHSMQAKPTLAQPTDSRRLIRRLIVGAIVIFILGLALSKALDPYDSRGIVAIPHGDHNHYVPRDRDPNVSISNFPTVPPTANERILPDGRVVPLQ